MGPEHPHRRYHPLRDEWVLVSPHRDKRPWQGAVERAMPVERPAHDPACPLCPGNVRAGGAINPRYEGTYVFTNDFPALRNEDLEWGHDVAPQVEDEALLFQSLPVRGECRVICFSPRHDLTLAQMPVPEIRRVVDLWAELDRELGETYAWVQIFENKGEAMGCSNPHPHGQVWAMDTLPTEAEKEDRTQRAYVERVGRAMLDDVAAQELTRGERVVDVNEEWLAVVPFWAVWPFETLILPRRPWTRLEAVDEAAKEGLAELLGSLLPRYDRLFNTDFPYSMGWHGAPHDGRDPSAWRLHGHVYPPLLRSATVRKHMVGFELFAEAQRDLTPEAAATRLRDAYAVGSSNPSFIR